MLTHGGGRAHSPVKPQIGTYLQIKQSGEVRFRSSESVKPRRWTNNFSFSDFSWWIANKETVKQVFLTWIVSVFKLTQKASLARSRAVMRFMVALPRWVLSDGKRQKETRLARMPNMDTQFPHRNIIPGIPYNECKPLVSVQCDWARARGKSHLQGKHWLFMWITSIFNQDIQ